MTAVLVLTGCAARTGDIASGPKRQAPPERPAAGAVASPTSRPAAPPNLPEAPAAEIGRSVEGRPLLLEHFGETGPILFVFGGIHGSEPTSAHVARELVALLRLEPELCRKLQVAVLAEANPDGLLTGRRANANGVDLNRNFPARNWRSERRGRHGPAAASEPETRAIITAIERLRPACVISIHAIRGPRQCNNYDGPGRELAELMSRYNGYPVAPTIGYPTPGSFGSWCGIDLGLPTITLELPQGVSGAECWERNREALLAVMRELSRLSSQAATSTIRQPSPAVLSRAPAFNTRVEFSIRARGF